MAKSNNEISTQVKEGMKEGLNLQEISWCETYLRTLSITQACKEAGISKSQYQLMLGKPGIVHYIMMRSDQHRKALEREIEEELSRDKLAKVLEGIILDPLTNNEVCLRAISQLNAMREFDKKTSLASGEPETEEAKPKLTQAEAEELLKTMRAKAGKGE